MALSLTLGGCAGHSAKTLKARAALDSGKPDDARELINAQLKVKDSTSLPDKIKKDTALLVLDRSMVSQSLEDYAASSSDLQFADKQVEMLDMSRSALDSIGKHIFSDDTGPYQSPPYEKLLINTMNIVNYLARHDLNGARIEARRLSILQKYLRDNKNPAVALNAPGGYLAGFVFERSGRPDIALRYYDEALEHKDFASLAEPIARLSQSGAYSTPRLREFLQRHKKDVAVETPAAGDDSGDVLVVVNYGRVPAKIAKRIPIGLALTYATLYLSPSYTTTTNRLAAQGLVTWINYPELEETSRRVSMPSLDVDGRRVALENAATVDEEARAAYEKVRGKIIAAAITRLVTRAIAGESAGAATRAASDSGLLGALVSIFTQAALTAADTPDTRSWATLPARIAVGRLRMAPGRHTIRITAQGVTKTQTFQLEPGGFETVVLTVLR